MKHVGAVGIFATALIALLPAPAPAGAEQVLLYKVVGGGDEGIIVRSNGDAYQIRKGIGCLGFASQEGRTIFVTSPGLFLGIGSEVVIPDRGQTCRVWESTALGNVSGLGQPAPVVRPPASPRPPGTGSAPQPPVLVAATQAALTLLGIAPGPLDGALGEKTAEAIRRFQLSKGLSPSGTPDTATRLALSNELAKRFPEDENVLTIVAGLLATSPEGSPSPGAGCEEGHWVQSVSAGGAVVLLEDGSIWEVDLIDKIDTMLWLPTEEVLVCGWTLVNTDNGDKVHATRLK